MKERIENLEHLRAERARLKNELTVSRSRIDQQVEEVKEELRPARQATQFLSSFLTNKRNGLVPTTVGLGINTILSQRLLAAAPWYIRLTVPFVLKNVTTNFLMDDKKDLVVKALTWVKDVTEDKPKETPTETPKQESALKRQILNSPPVDVLESALRWLKRVTDEKPITDQARLLADPNAPKPPHVNGNGKHHSVAY